LLQSTTASVTVLDAAREDALGWIDRWTVGAYFQNLREDTVADYRDEFGTLNAVSDYESRNASLYAQLAHDFSADTRLILGLRAEAYKVGTDSTGTDSGVYAGDLASGDAEEDGTLWGGKLTLEHDLNDAHMAFVSAARGYKAGGANVPSFLVAGDPATYDDETLYNFELGLRSDWLDGALWAKNLFDERYSKRVFFFDNFDGGTKQYRSPADPRQIGATVNYSW